MVGNSAQQAAVIPHNLIMEDRKKLSLSGVTEVEAFEEDNLLIRTVKGTLTIRGNDLKMDSYVSETGDLSIRGDIYALVYVNDSKEKEGLLSRIFR